MNRKGMSQTLALIVAASVLMMTALTVIFMVQGGLGDVNRNTDLSSCRGTVQGICAGTDATQQTPSVCLDEDGTLAPGADAITGVEGPDTLDCAEY